jgi:NodT family efflux transporter outer membrane factor (OMF) lipoprotein
MKTTKYFIKFAFALLLFYSCKIPQQAQQKPLMPAPETFGSNTDTTNTATINWKQFFSDKNLVSIIDTALINNWDIQIAIQRIQQAQSNVLLTKGALKPFVDAGVMPSIRKFGEYTMDGAGNKGVPIVNGTEVPVHLPDYLVGLQSTWEIDLWGKLKNKKLSAVNRFLASAEGRYIVVTNLIAEIATSYYDLIGLDQSLRIIDETILLQDSALALIKLQKEALTATELGVKQFEAQLLNLRSLRLEMLQQIAVTENTINLLAGRYPQPVIRDTAFSYSNLISKINAGIPSQLLQNRPDIRQAEFELMASKADVKSAKAAFYPSLNITAGLGLQAFKPNLLFNATSITYNTFGNLMAPLINRSAIKAEFNFANAVQLEAMYNYQKAIVNGYVEVYNQILQVKNLLQVFELKTQEVNALTEAIKASTMLFRANRANYIDVLLAQQNTLQAKLALVETQKKQLLAAVNMYKALGGGWR